VLFGDRPPHRNRICNNGIEIKIYPIFDLFICIIMFVFMVGTTGTVDFITALPPELSLHVLLFVPLSAVGCTLSLVSRAWKRCTANRLFLGHSGEHCSPLDLGGVCGCWRRFADDDALWRAAVAASALTGGEEEEDDDDDGARGFKAVLKEALLSNPLRDTCLPAPLRERFLDDGGRNLT
jgi:hypothetical protein